MSYLGPRSETREAHGRDVRTVWWMKPTYACDGCGKIMAHAGMHFPPCEGDWCTEGCHVFAAHHEPQPPREDATALTDPWWDGSVLRVRA